MSVDDHSRAVRARTRERLRTGSPFFMLEQLSKRGLKENNNITNAVRKETHSRII
jgi:hypothetical protein